MSATSAHPSTYQAAPHQLTKNQRGVWLIPLTLLVGGTFLVLMAGRQEVARWYFAATMNAVEDERFADAIDTATQGLEWDPEYVPLIEMRAEASLPIEDFASALSDYERIRELAATDESFNEADIAPLVGKATVLQRMNRFSESIAMWDKVVDFREEQYRLRDDSESRQAYAMALNNRAYTEAQAGTRGVTGIDLQKSLADARLAVSLRRRTVDPVMVDTLGYLLLLNRRNEEALAQLENAVVHTRLEHEVIMERYRRRTQDRHSPDALARLARQLDQQLSVIVHHRAEAYAALGARERASADIEEATRLGYRVEDGIW